MCALSCDVVYVLFECVCLCLCLIAGLNIECLWVLSVLHCVLYEWYVRVFCVCVCFVFCAFVDEHVFVSFVSDSLCDVVCFVFLF